MGVVDDEPEGESPVSPEERSPLMSLLNTPKTVPSLFLHRASSSQKQQDNQCALADLLRPASSRSSAVGFPTRDLSTPTVCCEDYGREEDCEDEGHVVWDWTSQPGHGEGDVAVRRAPTPDCLDV